MEGLPGSPAVKSLHTTAGGAGSKPRGAKFLHAAWPNKTKAMDRSDLLSDDTDLSGTLPLAELNPPS